MINFSGAIAVGLALALSGCAAPASDSGSLSGTPSASETALGSPEDPPKPNWEPLEFESEEIQPDVHRGVWPDEEGKFLLDGSWHVGEGLDIPSLSIVSNYHENLGCRWRVLASDGQVVEEVEASLPMGNEIQLLEGDVLQSSGCSVWAVYPPSPGDLNEHGSSSEGFMNSGTSQHVGDPFSASGSYVVGESIPPGEYELLRSPEARGQCAFSVSRRTPDGRFIADVEFSSSNAGARSLMRHEVTLKRGQLFETDGCGAWQKWEWTE